MYPVTSYLIIRNVSKTIHKVCLTLEIYNTTELQRKQKPVLKGRIDP